MKTQQHTPTTDTSHRRHQPSPHGEAGGHHYRKLTWMVALMFVAMFLLMYAMVYRLTNVYLLSLNQFYMAALMTGAMVVIELVIMGGMYPDKQRNVVLIVIAAIVTGGSWFAIREQVGIGDQQFLRSMIPHHEGALLMCKEAPLSDERLVGLCRQILESQEREIQQMKALLAESEKG